MAFHRILSVFTAQNLLLLSTSLLKKGIENVDLLCNNRDKTQNLKTKSENE